MAACVVKGAVKLGARLTDERAIRLLFGLMITAATTDLGSSLFLLTGPWLMYDLTRSAFWVSTVSVATGILFWAGPALGWLVDRYDRRRLLIWALVAQGMGAGGLAWLVDHGAASVMWVLVAAVVVTAGLRLQMLAASAIRMAITPTEARLRLNSWWSIVTLLASYGAPGVAGFLLDWHGVGFALAVQGFSIVPMLVSALGLPRARATLSPTTPGGNFRHALRALQSERGMWLFTWMMAFWNWTFAGFMALLVFFYRDNLHFTAGQAGIAGLIGGVIPMITALGGSALNRRVGPGRLLMGGVMLSGLGMLALPSLGTPLAVGGALGVMDGPIGPVLAALSTMAQHRIPSHLFGRAQALRMLISMGATPTAGLAAGAAAGQLGAPPVLVGLGVATVLGGMVAAWRTPLGRVTLLGTVTPTPPPTPAPVGQD